MLVSQPQGSALSAEGSIMHTVGRRWLSDGWKCWLLRCRRGQAYSRSAGDGQWLLFNDGSVTAVQAGEEASIVTAAAYVLFYRLRSAQ